jgi:hypothetical protein
VNLESKLEFIRPTLLNEKGISSWFSQRNPEFRLQSSGIDGFNLGIFTEESEDTLAVNLAILSSITQTDELNMAITRQVHSAKVAEVNRGGLFEEVDALVSNVPGLLLTIQVADCAAILVGDPVNRVVGAAHAGWRGAAGGILPEMLTKMKSLGADAEYSRAYISPCISLDKFEVGDEVASQFPDRFVDRNSYAKAHVDLKSYLKHQLQDFGMKEDHIEVDASCTMNDKSRFYSYRRDGKKTGRMMALIKLDKSA